MFRTKAVKMLPLIIILLKRISDENNFLYRSDTTVAKLALDEVCSQSSHSLEKCQTRFIITLKLKSLYFFRSIQKYKHFRGQANSFYLTSFYLLFLEGI